MPGPAPKPPEARRRRNAPLANTVKLPAAGRPGRAPRWPLAGNAPKLWRELWSTPQAVAWEQLGWTRVVARYTQILFIAELQLTPFGDLNDDSDGDRGRAGNAVSLLAEARQLEDRLGLTPMAMLRLRWEVIAADTDTTASATSPVSRPRVKAVDTGAVAGS